MKVTYFTGKNVLVTGGAGICGKAAIKRLLSEGAFVRATQFTSRKININHRNLEVVTCDLMNYEDCQRIVKDIDVVLNFVAYIRGAKNQTANPMELVRNNLIPSVNMIEASCKEKVKVFGFVGSSTMYPDVSYPVFEYEAFDNEPAKVYTGVGWMKRYCEKMCMYYHSISSTKFAMIRTTAIYGPEDTFDPERCHVIPDLIIKASKKLSPFEIWGNGEQLRDFVYVDDVIDGLFKTIDIHPNADPINIATGDATSIKTLAKTITDEFNYDPEFIFNTSKPTMIPIRLVSVKKANDILNWKANTNLKNGIKQTVQWFKQNIQL